MVSVRDLLHYDLPYAADIFALLLVVLISDLRLASPCCVR